MTNPTQKLWTFAHEPTSFDDMILNGDIRRKLGKAMLEMPNLLLTGPAGVGKGTFTHIFLKQTGVDYLWINCSDETSIDNIRTKVKSFATSLGITPIKFVILNEADFLSVPGQAMLRDLMEQVQSITRFILMCNYGHKIINELKSRCQQVEMSNPPLEDIAKFSMKILKDEGVFVEKVDYVVQVVKKLYPDIRSIINTLQLNTHNNKISSIRIGNTSDTYEKIFSYSLVGDLDGIRKTLRSNTINYTELYQHFFESVDRMKSPGDAIIEISEGLYRDSIIAIHEIGFIGCVLKLMKKGCL